MKKLTIITLTLIIVLSLTSAIYASPTSYGSNIGIRREFEESSYVILAGIISLEKGESIIVGPGLAGAVRIIPNLYIIAASGLDVVYSLNDNLLLGLGLNPTENFNLLGEYIFLSKPSYQLATNFRLGTSGTGLSLLGIYDISPDLALSASAKISYGYKNKNLNFYGNLLFEYQDYLGVLLSINFPDLLKLTSERNSLKLQLFGDIPIAHKFSLSYLASFSAINIINESKNTNFEFQIGPGVKYDINDKFNIKLYYAFTRGTKTIYELQDNVLVEVSVEPRYSHLISLWLEYRF